MGKGHTTPGSILIEVSGVLKGNVPSFDFYSEKYSLPIQRWGEGHKYTRSTMKEEGERKDTLHHFRFLKMSTSICPLKVKCKRQGSETAFTGCLDCGGL